MTSDGENQIGPKMDSPSDERSNPRSAPPRQALFPLPALAVIALYMFVLAGMIIVGAAHGYIRPLFLIFSAVFIATALGLLMLFRWAWTLALAAVVLLTGLFLWRYTAHHDASALLQGLLNMVIFLYLVRPEVRSHLR